jgi:hypothetical protein
MLAVPDHHEASGPRDQPADTGVPVLREKGEGMTPTIFDAEISGSYAALEPPRPRVVPQDFLQVPAHASAWLEAYDRTVTAQQCQRPDVMEAPVQERQPRRKTIRTAPPAVPAPAQVPPTMLSILETRITKQL